MAGTRNGTVWKVGMAALAVIVAISTFALGHTLGSSQISEIEERVRTLETKGGSDIAVMKEKLCNIEKKLTKIDTKIDAFHGVNTGGN